MLAVPQTGPAKVRAPTQQRLPPLAPEVARQQSAGGFDDRSREEERGEKRDRDELRSPPPSCRMLRVVQLDQQRQERRMLRIEFADLAERSPRLTEAVLLERESGSKDHVLHP